MMVWAKRGFPYLTWPLFTSPDLEGKVCAGVTTREGGISQPPFHSANMAFNRGDLPEAVKENRRRLCAEFHLPPEAFCCGSQVHGTRIEEAAPDRRSFPETDGLVTHSTGLLLAVFTADCIPLILYDPENHAAAALHAGWRGTAAGILPQGIQLMRERYGSDPRQLRLGIGPGVCAPCYEVGREVEEALAKSLQTPQKEAWCSPLPSGRTGVDVAMANCLQAREQGLTPDHIEMANQLCTRENPHLYSHRRDGKTAGRQAGFILLK